MSDSMEKARALMGDMCEEPPPWCFNHINSCECRNAIAAAMDEAAREAAAQWQPIDTAPIGEHVLVCSPHGVICIAGRSGDSGLWICDDGAWSPQWRPTHWQPLPALPIPAPAEQHLCEAGRTMPAGPPCPWCGADAEGPCKDRRLP